MFLDLGLWISWSLVFGLGCGVQGSGFRGGDGGGVVSGLSFWNGAGQCKKRRHCSQMAPLGHVGKSLGLYSGGIDSGTKTLGIPTSVSECAIAQRVEFFSSLSVNMPVDACSSSDQLPPGAFQWGELMQGVQKMGAVLNSFSRKPINRRAFRGAFAVFHAPTEIWIFATWFSFHPS